MAEDPTPTGEDDPEARALILVAKRLDEAERQTDSMHAIEPKLRALTEDLAASDPTADPEVETLLVSAFEALEYMLTTKEGRMAFEPYLQMSDGTTRPALLEDQSDDVVRRWIALRRHTTGVAWRSRLGHLAVAADRVVQGRQRVDLARDVIGDYLTIPPSWTSGLGALKSCQAAIQLARQFGLGDRLEEAIAATISTAEGELAEQNPAPGIVLGATRVLLALPNPPDAVADLLDQAGVAFAADVHNSDSVFEQQLELAADDPVRRADLWRRRVNRWLDAARTEDGPRKAWFLQKAVELASAAGDAELRRTATIAMQQITIADLQLQGFESSIILRHDQMNELVRPIAEAAGWREALIAFATLGPPTGDVAKNRKAAQEQAAEFVFSSLFPVTRVGGDGLPRFTATTDDEKADHRLAQHEIFRLQVMGGVVAEALLRLPEHHGLPSLRELTDFIATSNVVSEPVAAGLARSLHRWWAGDYEGAAFTAMPRVETLARELLLTADAAVYRLQRRQTPGQYAGLGYLLDALSTKGLDESWYRCFRTVLTGPAGWNIRNELSHGFVDNVEFVLAALILQLALHLAAQPVTVEGGTAAEPSDG